MRRAVIGDRRLLHPVQQLLKGTKIRLIEQKLARIGPPLGHDGRSFKPDEARTALGEALVTAKGEFTWPAVRRAVTALQRVNGQRVGRLQRPDFDPAAQRLEVGVQPDIEAQRGDLGL